MVNFNTISKDEFLNNYWQKKPLVIRGALPDFINQITPDELAGLAMEDDIESRLVTHTPDQQPSWHLKTGPFLESDFQALSDNNWTLLVNGVDKILPELGLLFDNFNFIPQWRVDDLMISYAVNNGSVGPHYDLYDVFLYQAKGSRKWSLTSQNCTEDNFIQDVDLRIMQKFNIESEYILNEGDMLYLPAKIGHYGVAINDECMTYSFGYRSYSDQELWDDFGDYMSENNSINHLYKDPNWADLKGSSLITANSWLNAKQALQEMLNDDDKLKLWFGCYATRLDAQSHNLMPEPITEKPTTFMRILTKSHGLMRNTCCRFAYIEQGENSPATLFINGSKWDTSLVSKEFIKLVANHRILTIAQLEPWLNNHANQDFLFQLWQQQWLEIISSLHNNQN
jgi:50S ribosomal protein L16 3-hydroxylase